MFFLFCALFCVLFCAKQGLAIRGHFEGPDSKNRENFLELFHFKAQENLEEDLEESVNRKNRRIVFFYIIFIKI